MNTASETAITAGINKGFLYQMGQLIYNEMVSRIGLAAKRMPPKEPDMKKK